MSGWEEAIALVGSVFSEAGTAGGAGASAAEAGGAMTGLAGMGPELSTATTPAFSAGGGASPKAPNAMGNLMDKGSSAGNVAQQLMKMAANNKPQGGAPMPGLPQRQGGGTQPSIQQFLQMLSQRRPVAMRGIPGLQ